MTRLSKNGVGDALAMLWTRLSIRPRPLTYPPLDRLKAQEEVLQKECCSQFTPIMKREADKSRGEVFPLMWYVSDAEVTATQHFILAKAVLIAENPRIK